MPLIPSLVNLKYNDIADDLAKGGTSMTQVNEEPLLYLELYSKCKISINISWKQPLPHPWYLSQCPGASISFIGDRRDETTFLLDCRRDI
ncbi:RNase H domain-containing protein [Trichonephila clavipes]|nr:RNase H domain-containing protein [Trichonephila clavipes]